MISILINHETKISRLRLYIYILPSFSNNLFTKKKQGNKEYILKL
jgi:hypothetical protein